MGQRLIGGLKETIHGGQLLPLSQFFQRRQRHAAIETKRAHGGSTQGRDMTAYGKGLPQVHGDAANVGAFTAVNAQIHLGARTGAKGQQFQLKNGHSPGLTLHFHARAGKLIQGLAIALNRRIHGRQLLQLTPKIFQRPFQGRLVNT